MQRFVEIWGDIWEQNEAMPNMARVEEMKAEQDQRANLASEFAISDENMKKEIANQKDWTTPEIDAIQKFWWKKFELAQKALRKAFADLHMDTAMVP